jgi:hypothetical protein
MPLEELTIGKDLTYQEYPVKILDTSENVTCIFVFLSPRSILLFAKI